jgi:hypothetical protein
VDSGTSQQPTRIVHRVVSLAPYALGVLIGLVSVLWYSREFALWLVSVIVLASANIVMVRLDRRYRSRRQG